MAYGWRREPVCGIYVLFERPVVYVGSAVDIPRRWRAHRVLLRSHRHPRRDVQAAWDHGTLTFSIVERASAEDLAEREAAWIERLARDGWHVCNVVRCPTRHSKE
jgi:hypothetical protein